MSEMKQCPFLNDRVVKEDAINAECTAPTKDCCPKLRSTKKAVTRQCWRMTMLTEAEVKDRETKAAARKANQKPKVAKPAAEKKTPGRKPKQKEPAKIENAETLFDKQPAVAETPAAPAVTPAPSETPAPVTSPAPQDDTQTA